MRKELTGIAMRHGLLALWGCIVFVTGILFVVPAGMAHAGQALRPTSGTCTYTVEKTKDGQTQYVLTGPGCGAVVKSIKEKSAQTKVYSGGDCSGPCSCTWVDECGKNGCFYCRGCCREILTLAIRR
ncbi:MAG TPA: hypothetical protein PLI53_06025 [Geobacteraceae bacterium]|nr:hypothetical protein [Geobacteraceae bacterium]